MRGLVLEGVSGSGKTTLFAALQRLLAVARPAATKLILSEHYTDRLLERRRGALTVAEALDHVDAVLGPVDTLAALEAGGHFAGRGGDADVYVLIERLLGSHLAYLARRGALPSPDQAERVAAVHARLAGHHVGVAVLHLAPDVLPVALLSTRAHRSEAWRRWLASHGDDDAIVAAFTAWQDALLAAFDALPPRLRPELLTVTRPGDPDEAEALASRLAERWLLG